DEQRQTGESLSHVAVAGRQPHAHTRREPDHARLRAETMRVTRLASTQPSMRTQSPLLSLISIAPEPRVPLRRRAERTPSPLSAVAGSSATSTGANVSAGAALGSDRLSVMSPFASAWRRHAKSWLALMPR